jgi:hypothetical protein
MEASAVRARSRAATSYNWKRLKDFHKLIRDMLAAWGRR